MKLTDRLSLIHAGYSLKEIKAFEEEEKAAVENPIVEEEQKQPETHIEENKVEEPDYKTMYEELQQKLNETSKMVEDLQKENRNRDVGEPISNPYEDFKKMLIER